MTRCWECGKVTTGPICIKCMNKIKPHKKDAGFLLDWLL